MFGYLQGATIEREAKVHPPVVGSQLRVASEKALTFFDLLEARLVKELRALRISLQSIRAAALHAREFFNSPHPFVLRRIRTDGKRIFAEAAAATGDAELLDLVSRQYAIQRIIERSLIYQIEFGPDEAAERWFPVQNSRAIVVDPTRSFGRPIVTEFGVPTQVLFDAFIAEGKDRAAVSRAFEVPVAVVDRAVRFEYDMQGAAQLEARRALH
jgi:uncharacterized protein (DUF433 family)